MAIDAVKGELVTAKLTPSFEQARSWIEALPGPAAVAYGAGPTGFGLYRSLSAAGVALRGRGAEQVAAAGR